MKKSFLLILFFSVITGASSSLASMIQIYDYKGTYDADRYTDLFLYEFKVCDVNVVNLARIYKSDFNTIVKIDQYSQTTQKLIDMFQRTYIPRPEIERDEFTYMYLNNLLYGKILFLDAPPNDGGFAHGIYFHPIPDLSAYHINALYLDNSFSTNGATGEYDIKFLADVTPIVPEPSTILLLGVGLSVLVFIRKKISI